MDEDPSSIREEIASTREQIGETIDELAAKTDVKGRARDWAEDKREAISDRISHLKEERLVALGEAGRPSRWGTAFRERLVRPVAMRTGLSETQAAALIGGAAVLAATVLIRRIVGR